LREAIILAGGLGTRLRSVTGNDLPKPMADVAGKPFLHYLLEQLKRWNVDRVVFSVGHKYEIIETTFGEHYLGMQIAYSVEAEPMGTGGAIRLALEHIEDDGCFILNGDSYFNTAFDAIEDVFNINDADLVMALKHVENSDRYGTVQLDDQHRITQFNEKNFVESGYINAGIYCATKSLLDKLPQQQKFSFEEDYLKPFAQRDRIYGVLSDAYFIDIGVPYDYRKANEDFSTRR
jgi:D-glycero-alpha-D-manno-heptose 1-phosphate guanylyltransferase